MNLRQEVWTRRGYILFQSPILWGMSNERDSSFTYLTNSVLSQKFVFSIVYEYFRFFVESFLKNLGDEPNYKSE